MGFHTGKCSVLLSFTHHSLHWLIFLEPIKHASYQVELSFLVYTNLGHSAPSDLTVTLRYHHTGLLKPCSLAVMLFMKDTHTTSYYLLVLKWTQNNIRV